MTRPSDKNLVCGRMLCGGILLAEIPDAAYEAVTPLRHVDAHRLDGIPPGVILCPYRKTQLQKCSFAEDLWECHGVAVHVSRDWDWRRILPAKINPLYSHVGFPCVLYDDYVEVPAADVARAEARNPTAGEQPEQGGNGVEQGREQVHAS